ncbi:molybdate ABC transporter substrate-binding protein [Solirubrobacter sp. CPCC 204708]|uniref:Molybdate ABC transporter substrate-binding protein n=1 Tax=Solirubrobacter deserti TaxID=2282478 RepID=A0ABT4RIQ1_9ACTN|nr:molybdate ABC transporter substrate-binding protein [Solirubrobacter deserti]MBE2320800.1 molybdate ABC transporter substrate-binding protein [Solirubrobacter deserti]MDA0138435.1 molybdate ABC transporter substrate-binding protein [Solirubrobacter deserti]
MRFRLLALALLVVLPACGGAAADTPVTVYAAASLRDVFPAIDKAPRYNFAGSNQLQTQIERGAPADVFASASAKEPTALHAAGRCSRPVAFAGNAVVLMVPTGNPGRVTSLQSLASGPRRRLAVGAEDVPVGKYTRELLDNAGLSDVLARHTVSNEPDVASLSAKVALGSADAGFAYNTDARATGDRVEVIRLPADVQPKIQYLLCAVQREGANTEAAQAFIDQVRSPEGRSVLQRLGFTPPPGD